MNDLYIVIPDDVFQLEHESSNPSLFFSVEIKFIK